MSCVFPEMFFSNWNKRKQRRASTVNWYVLQSWEEQSPNANNMLKVVGFFVLMASALSTELEGKPSGGGQLNNGSLNPKISKKVDFPSSKMKK